jgi:tagaturonate reductase
MQIVISNTTELGMRLETDDDIFAATPHSFPAKLLSFLHTRYTFFSGSETAGMIIVPTELIPNNGLILKALVNELAQKQGLEEAFLNWLNTHNIFCNSLVDRIVPGKPSSEEFAMLSQQLGYEDNLLAVSESYLLWAIEGSERVKSVLSFAAADPRIIIAENIDKYQELKLRLLNGTHTFCCGLAHLQGFKIVKDALQDADFEHFIKNLILQEIAPNIPYVLEKQEAENFALQVLDRFRNPYIEHHWLNITFAYTSKMETRCLPMIIKAIKNEGNIPPLMAQGFAAYCRFMETNSKNDKGQFEGNWQSATYIIQDSKAEFFYQNQEEKNENYFYKLLINKDLWNNTLDKEFDDITLKKVSKTIYKAYQAL